MNKQLQVVVNSANRKLGPAVVSTYRPVGKTCPADCALLKSGCYALKGFTRFSSERSKAKQSDFSEIVASGKTLLRHHVSGDVFKNDELDVFYVQSVIDFHAKNPHIFGWAYTHRLADWVKAGFTQSQIPKNLTIIASCDTQEQIDFAIKNNFRYARVTTERKINAGEKLCPFDVALQSKKIDNIKINCGTCKACWKQGEKSNIVFLKH